MGKPIEVDYVKAQKLLRKLSEATGRSMRDVVRQGGRVASMKLAMGTAPFGGKTAKPKMLKTIAADYAGLINNPGRIYEQLWKKSKGAAIAFWKARKESKMKGGRDSSGRFLKDQLSGGEEEMRRIAERYLGVSMVSSVSKAEYYAKTRAPKRYGSGGITPSRNRSGRVPGFVGVFKYAQTVAPMVKEAAKNIFRAKAGWIACAKLLGGTRRPSGVRDLPSLASGAMGRTDEGTVSFGGSGMGSFVTITNKVPYIDGLLSRTGRNEAIDLAFKNMMSYARATLRGIAKQARAGVPA